MTLERIVFSVNGAPLPHTSAALDQSAEETTRTAQFDIAWTGAGIPCAPDDEATITVSGALWGTGYVRDVRPGHDENSRTYSVSFVSRSCDATECSIDHPTGLKRDADLGDIAREFDVLGVGVEVKAKTIKKAVHKVRPGETLFETLETDARAQGVLIHDSPEGKLVLADKPEGRHAERAFAWRQHQEGVGQPFWRDKFFERQGSRAGVDRGQCLGIAGGGGGQGHSPPAAAADRAV
ncbi:hypothetical protein OEG86_13420 [Hoeflea alexandrii]|uniref:hypothetical protein n=1 Tax=Hoeflea alexandrii TaxID=288436 RepID=UPI00226EB35A|nr:hypothetical protein [Hoeflea alexandrii]MCY0153075.1 hypothetical protein [Hoeflea alexandrii]